MDYGEYYKSDQKKKEDRIFLEFNRRYGIDESDSYAAVRGVANALCVTVIVALFIWVAFF
jgi:hypothetical protein